MGERGANAGRKKPRNALGRTESNAPRFEFGLDRGPHLRSPGEFGFDGNDEIGLVHPAAGVGSAVPALQRDRADVVAFFFVEQFVE